MSDLHDLLAACDPADPLGRPTLRQEIAERFGIEAHVPVPKRCKRGHELTADNRRALGAGRKGDCRACERARRAQAQDWGDDG